MRPLLAPWAIGIANAVLACGILIFAGGFFPYKGFLPGLASKQRLDEAETSASPFDKVVFMVVDALRSDFVYGNTSEFKFTQALIRSGAAIPFTGHASPPTITMPRVKAITTGSVPSFVDLVLNFAESDTSSTLAQQDSWLAQIRAQEKGLLVMYGDDTWLRLFPGFFSRADGTTSFFVSDFTEVDNNVTRHVPDELRKDDWSAMVLHYLGLDHIGHKTGPKGPNMPAKQREMDGIVKQIYTAMEQYDHLQSCLLVLLGDHGMNEGGNHGASSPGEVSTGLTFISPKFKSVFEGFASPIHDAVDYTFYDVVQQSDIAPTLAALLGFPVPRNNLGIIIPRLLEIWTRKQDQYELLFENAWQISQIMEATFPDEFRIEMRNISCPSPALSDAELLACEWKSIDNLTRDNIKDNDYDLAITKTRSFLHKAQSILSKAASNYDLTKLRLGIALSSVSCVLSFTVTFRSVWIKALPSFSFVFVTLAYGGTMFASSYVEEEHQFWYWTTSGWLMLWFCKAGRYGIPGSAANQMNFLVAILLFGVVRRWKQTGQKYAGETDLSSELARWSPSLLWVLIIVTYTIFSRRLSQRAMKWMDTKQMALLPVLISIFAIVFKVAFTAADAPELLDKVAFLQPLVVFVSKYSLNNLVRIVFLGLAQLLACAAYYEAPWKNFEQLCSFLDSFHDLLSLFLITQTRTINIPLFLAFNIQLRFLLRQAELLQNFEITTTCILFQYSSFFLFGGTNAISSVDLSNAYNGVGGYSVLAVGILTFVSNWAGTIWWTVALHRLLCEKARISGRVGGFRHFAHLTTFTSFSTLAVMSACTALREHLFIWTVFSPKYLYIIAWVFGQHFVINGLVASLSSIPIR